MSGQEQRAPRGLYFKAEDRPELKAKPKNNKVPDAYGVECGQRSRKLAKVLEDARNVVKAADALPSMDDAGLTIHGIEYIAARIEFLVDSFQILSDDVEAAGGRWERANPPALADDEAPAGDRAAMWDVPRYEGVPTITGELSHDSISQLIDSHRKGPSPLQWGQAL